MHLKMKKFYLRMSKNKVFVYNNFYYIREVKLKPLNKNERLEFGNPKGEMKVFM